MTGHVGDLAQPADAGGRARRLAINLGNLGKVVQVVQEVQALQVVQVVPAAQVVPDYQDSQVQPSPDPEISGKKMRAPDAPLKILY